MRWPDPRVPLKPFIRQDDVPYCRRECPRDKASHPCRLYGEQIGVCAPAVREMAARIAQLEAEA